MNMKTIKKFHGAVARGDSVAASMLLCKDVHLLESVYRGQTAIFGGVMYNRVGVVKYLIYCGACLETTNNHGDNPLLVALQTEKLVDSEIIDLLVQRTLRTLSTSQQLLISYLQKKRTCVDGTEAMKTMIEGGEDIWALDLQSRGWAQCSPEVRLLVERHRRWHITHIIKKIVKAPRVVSVRTEYLDSDPLVSLAADTKIMKCLPDEIWGDVMGYLG